jgi:hypothetical protein
MNPIATSPEFTLFDEPSKACPGGVVWALNTDRRAWIYFLPPSPTRRTHRG